MLALTSPLIAFRVDSGPEIGGGHVMRCLALADRLRARGAQVCFIVAPRAGDLSPRIRAAGFPLREIEAGSAESDADATAAALHERPAWLVADRYGVEAAWARRLRPVVDRIMIIDDLANRPHDCDLLVDQNWLGAATDARYSDLVPDGCLCLLGPRYALLDASYHVGARAPRSARELPRLFVSFGAYDRTGETLKVIEALALPELSGMPADVVLPRNIDTAEVRPGITLHEPREGLADLMMRADLAVGAGGITTWERLFCGLPSLVVTTAANQEPGTRALAGAGYVTYLGRSEDAKPETYREALARREGGRLDLAPLVDGRGAARVAEAMIPSSESQLAVRVAREDDVYDFFEWRNETLARAMSFTTDQVTWSEHTVWYAGRLRDRDTEMFVLEADGLAVGQLRLDYQESVTLLSYSIDPVARGRGWSRWFVEAALQRSARATATGVTARVKSENLASRKVFARLGWRSEPERSGVIELHSQPRQGNP